MTSPPRTTADAGILSERLEALETATVALTAEPSLERLLQLIVDLVKPLVGARYAALGIVDDDGRIERFITSGISDQVRAAIGPLPEGHGLLGVIISEGRTIRVHDVMADARRSGFPPSHPDMHSFLGTPVKVKGETIGNLYLTEKENGQDFSDDDVRTVETFARYAGIAMHNARLNAELERMAVVTERQRIGEDLHDGVIQSLYAVSLSLEDLGEVMREKPQEAEERVDHAIDAIHGTIRDLRSFIFELRPEIFEAGDLRVALEALTDEFRRTTTARVRLDTDGALEVPPAIAVQLLQLTREALSNVTRHAGATDVSVQLDARDGKLRLAIADNGRGFDTRQRPGAGHRGLTNMGDRARGIGAALDIRSGPGGTTVEIRLRARHPIRRSTP